MFGFEWTAPLNSLTLLFRSNVKEQWSTTVSIALGEGDVNKKSSSVAEINSKLHVAQNCLASHLPVKATNKLSSSVYSVACCFFFLNGESLSLFGYFIPSALKIDSSMSRVVQKAFASQVQKHGFSKTNLTRKEKKKSWDLFMSRMKQLN